MKIKKNDILKVIEVLQNAYDKLTEDEWYNFNEKDNSLIKENFILPKTPYCVEVNNKEEFLSVLDFFNEDEHSDIQHPIHKEYSPKTYPIYISHVSNDLKSVRYSYHNSHIDMFGKIIKYKNFKSYLK